MRCCLTLHDDDRKVDYVLDVDYTFLPGERETPRTMHDPGSPGTADAVEIDRVSLQSVTTWLGDYGLEACPAWNDENRAMSDWILRKYADDLREQVLEQHAQTVPDDDFDPTDERI